MKAYTDAYSFMKKNILLPVRGKYKFVVNYSGVQYNVVLDEPNRYASVFTMLEPGSFYARMNNGINTKIEGTPKGIDIWCYDNNYCDQLKSLSKAKSLGKSRWGTATDVAAMLGIFVALQEAMQFKF